MYHCLLLNVFGKVHCMVVGTKSADWLERGALGASAMCLAHCLALAVLFSLLPALSSALPLPERIHLWLLAAAVPMAGAALLQSRAVHGRSWPLVAGFTGLALMAAGAL